MRYLTTAPFFIYYKKKFEKIDHSNLNYLYRRNNYFIYHNYDFGFELDLDQDNCNENSFYSKLSKLIFIINDFYDEGIIIWGVNKNKKLEVLYES